MAYGATCVYTLSDDEEQMDSDQWLDFLEANESRGGAICTSSSDFKKLLLAVKDACNILKTRCRYEEEIDEMIIKLDRLEKKAKSLL